MRIDLHSHSTASDGTDAPAEVARRAGAGGLRVLALTDHDTVAGHPEAAAALPAGLTLVPGCELSCMDGGTSVHLLAYLFDPAEPELAAELRRLRSDRERRARGMVERLGQLGAEVAWTRVAELAGGESVGRPHVAAAMVEAGVVPDMEAAFGPEWLAPGGPAYVPKHAPHPLQAIQLVARAGGVSVLAHPAARERGGDRETGSDSAGTATGTALGIGEDAIAGLAAGGLTGVEVDHPQHDGAARARLRGLAAELDLVVTGGSDDHGRAGHDRLGCAGTAPEQYERLVSAARGASPVVGLE